MGHLVALDESADELDLCLLSLRLWRDFHALNPGVGDPVACGTLWVAENEHQLDEAHQRAARLSARGYHADAVSGERLRSLRTGTAARPVRRRARVRRQRGLPARSGRFSRAPAGRPGRRPVSGPARGPHRQRRQAA
ncbi:hypothetical protein LP420_31775 [Massilia sp. B-10]|nr:hypothetical protein LP420_31775 [Massilia sp. B-10]